MRNLQSPQTSYVKNREVSYAILPNTTSFAARCFVKQLCVRIFIDLMNEMHSPSTRSLLFYTRLNKKNMKLKNSIRMHSSIIRSIAVTYCVLFSYSHAQIYFSSNQIENRIFQGFWRIKMYA